MARGPISETTLTVSGIAPAPPPSEPAERVSAALAAALVTDLTAIRNNSRSTGGDPKKRLEANVARAQIALDRIDAAEVVD